MVLSAGSATTQGEGSVMWVFLTGNNFLSIPIKLILYGATLNALTFKVLHKGKDGYIPVRNLRALGSPCKSYLLNIALCTS